MTIFDQGTAAALFAAVVAGAALKYLAGNRIAKANKKQFRCVGKVQALWVYPFKSFRGVSVPEGTCTAVGLQYRGFTDRHWTVSTANGVYLTQRQEPTMALIEPVLNGDQIILRAPGMKPISIPADPAPTKENLSKVTVKTDTVASVDLGDEVADWLCSYFKKTGLRLHYSAPTLEKRDSSKNKKAWEHPALPGDMCAFSDYCGFMVMSNASLNDLNTRLASSVPLSNFRANIIVEECDPYAEDEWKFVRIGEAKLRALEPCTRCILITIDQTLGAKDKNEEPLKTLRKYRCKDPYGQKPCFGVNHTLDHPGTIKVGDPVYAICE